MVIKVDTFANPLISVGDVISAKHEYLGVTDNIKFVVTNVNQSWGDGLSTQIVARSIYSWPNGIIKKWQKIILQRMKLVKMLLYF